MQYWQKVFGHASAQRPRIDYVLKDLSFYAAASSLRRRIGRQMFFLGSLRGCGHEAC